MNELQVTCRYESHCVAVAALLRDQANVLSKLFADLNPPHLDDEDRRKFDEQVARDIWASLVGNKQ